MVKQSQNVAEARALLTSLVGETVGRDVPAFAALDALLARHPQADEKRGAGVVEFIVTTSPLNGAPELHLQRRDGTRIDVSWLKCARGRDNSPALQLRKAMRRAVLEQTLAIRNAAVDRAERCGLCGRALVRGDVHVDHIEPFGSLVREFLSGRRDVPLSFADDPVSHTAVFLEIDSGFARAWQEFHRDNATLRATCSFCNLRRRV